MGAYKHLLVGCNDGVETIVLNRPERRNALSPELITELALALDAAEAGPCGVAVLTGAGPAFCSGLDLTQLEAFDVADPDKSRNDAENLARVLRALYDFPKPVIAAVNGPAIAGGMSLATLPDITLATPDARLGMNEVRVGFVPAIEAAFLRRQVGEKRTRELLLSGRLLRAQEAMAMGLVSQIVPHEELLPTAYALAHSLLRNSPQAMQQVKELMIEHAHRTLDEEIEAAIEVNARQQSSDDFREGVEAFLLHRRADWPSLRALMTIN